MKEKNQQNFSQQPICTFRYSWSYRECILIKGEKMFHNFGFQCNYWENDSDDQIILCSDCISYNDSSVFEPVYRKLCTVLVLKEDSFLLNLHLKSADLQDLYSWDKCSHIWLPITARSGVQALSIECCLKYQIKLALQIRNVL